MQRRAKSDHQSDFFDGLARSGLQIVASYLRKERSSHTLQPTAVVHEAYIRLVHQKNPRWEERKHFFGVAARLMPQIPVKHVVIELASVPDIKSEWPESWSALADDFRTFLLTSRMSGVILILSSDEMFTPKTPYDFFVTG